jgi:hypothetical protein
MVAIRRALRGACRRVPRSAMTITLQRDPLMNDRKMKFV